jgi:hypothetical protein
VPALIILIQLNLHYGLRPLAIGESALVKVTLRDPAALTGITGVTLQSPPNLKVETEGVRIGELKEISWRVRAIAPGRFDLVVSDGKTVVTKKAAVGGRMEGVSPLRTGAHWVRNLLYPDETPIGSSSAIESIEILYPELDVTFLGWHVNWMILFFVLSLVFGYMFKGVLGVQI